MGDWPLQGDGQRWESTGLGTASRGVTITSGVLANTKGLWTELIASTAFDSSGVLFSMGHASTARDFLIDLGIGPALSEQVVVPDLLFASSHIGCTQSFFPIHIPAGSRLSARCACSTLSSNVMVMCNLVGQGFLPSSPLSRVTAYGPNAADSGGTEIDPGTTADTEGAWIELTASTTYPIRALVVAFGGIAGSTRAAGQWMVDIGIGGAGSEQIVFPNYQIRQNAAQSLQPLQIGPLPVSIPAGTRLAARAQCSLITASRLLDVAAYGIG